MAYNIPQFDTFGAINSFVMGDMSSILWSIFGIIVFFFVIYSAILLYHWFKYSIGKKVMQRALFSYFLISFILLFVIAYAGWQIAG